MAYSLKEYQKMETELQAMDDYIQHNCHFAELMKLAANVDGENATQIVKLTKDLLQIWLLEKLIAKPAMSSLSTRDVLKQAIDELILLTPDELKNYLLQGVFKDDWRLDDQLLAEKYQQANTSNSLTACLRQSMRLVMKLTDHQEANLQKYCELLKAALTLNQKLMEVA